MLSSLGGCFAVTCRAGLPGEVRARNLRCTASRGDVPHAQSAMAYREAAPGALERRQRLLRPGANGLRQCVVWRSSHIDS
jgi:hypothetical protein